MRTRRVLKGVQRVAGLVLGMACCAAPSFAADPPVITAPQGYVNLTQKFSDENPIYFGQHGFYNLDFRLLLHEINVPGTYFGNSISFFGSSVGLPPNHVPGDQGGYLGVQVKAPGDHLAIFSIFWSQAANPGAGAACVEGVEMWYNDGKPFEPPITDPNKTDPNRPVAGGPFHSCRLPITLVPGTIYRLRIWVGEIKPGEPQWWVAWLINDATGEQKMIGQILAPAHWELLHVPGGFIEQFEAMPNGCASIPSSKTTFYPARANNASWDIPVATLTTNVYGNCQAAVTPRYQAAPSPDGSVTVTIK